MIGGSMDWPLFSQKLLVLLGSLLVGLLVFAPWPVMADSFKSNATTVKVQAAGPAPGKVIYGPRTTPTQTSGPITATAGQVISGLKISNPNGPCITVRVPNVVVRDNIIGPCGTAGSPEGIGVLVENTANLTVEYNTFDTVSSGVYAIYAQHPILISHNSGKNIRGPIPRGQLVQFNGVSGGSGQSKITCNLSDVQGSAVEKVEDHINMYSSTGSSSQPIFIAYNRLRGGHSESGSGIMTGDSSAAGGGGYMHVYKNTIVNIGNVGVGVAGGTNIRVDSNRVYLDGRTSPSRLGMYAYAYIPNGGTMPTCRDHTFINNRVWGIDTIGQNGAENHFWHDTETCFNVTLTNNAFGDRSLNADIFNEIPSECQ